jgi:hypothetical protein
VNNLLKLIQVGKSEDAVKTVDEAQQLSKSSTLGVLSHASITQAHVLQVCRPLHVRNGLHGAQRAYKTFILPCANQSRQGFLNLQVSGKGAKAPKAKAPTKPAPLAAGKTGGRAKDGSTGQTADASVQREEEARLLAAVQSVRTSAATDAVGVEDRLKVVPVKISCSCIG